MKRSTFKRILIIPALVILLLAILIAGAFYGALNTNTGARLILSVLQGRLPGTLETARPEGDLSSGVSLRQVRFMDQGAVATAEQVLFAVSLDFFPLAATVNMLEVQSLALQLPPDTGESSPSELPSSLALPIAVTLKELRVQGFELIDPEGNPSFEFDRLSGSAWIHDSLDLENGVLELKPGRLGFGGKVDLVNPFQVELNLDSRLSLELGEDTGLTELDVQSRVEGNLERYRVSSAGWIDPPEFDRHRLELIASFNRDELLIQHLELEGPVFKLAAEGEMDTQGQNLRLPNFHLELVESNAVLDGSGNVDLEQETLAAEITWRDLAWPLDAEQADIESRSGQVRLSGHLEDWTLAGEAELESPGLPSGTLRVQAAGDRDHATVTILDGRVLGGEIKGQADYDWSETGSWSASLLLHRIETEALYPDLPAVINADLTAAGNLEPLSLDLDIRQLDGEIRNQKVNARGRLQYRAESLSFEDMLLEAENSTVALNGSTDSSAGLEFAANIVNLGTFLPHSSGAIQAGGHLSLHAGQPRLRLDLEAQDIAWEDLLLPRVSIKDSGGMETDVIAKLRVEAANPRFGGEQLDAIAMDFDIRRSSQALQLDARRSGLQLTADLTGNLRQQGLPLTESDWVGQIRSLVLSDEEKGALSLLEPADIELSLQRVAVDKACLGANSHSKVCLEAGWEQDGRFFTAVNLADVPLDLIQLMYETDFELTQIVAGEARWEIVPGKPPSAYANIRLSPGDIRYSGEEESLLATGEGLLGFRLEGGRLSGGKFDLPLPGLGEIDLEFSAANIADGLDSDLDGRLRLRLADLDILTLFVPLADQANGRLDVDFALSGTAGNPNFSGAISLADGSIIHEASGLSFKDIQLSGEVIGNDETHISGSFKALEGTGHLQGVVDLSDILSPRVVLNLNGENLTLFDAPDLKVVAEPDIRLDWHEGVIGIDGTLLIPSARIAPSIVPRSAVTESADLEIVAGALPVSDIEEEPDSNIAIRGNLGVTLGDGVQLDLSVAKADVAGTVDFSWQDDALPLANGNYQMTGQILAFGQLLQITEARIGFPNVPADNPQLNIRAERQIFGNSEIRRAGVYVTGTLRRPIIEPYTDPMTNRERAQTLLITGSDFNMETGVGAVDIGTYIAPRIFVSYGVGVFEDENVISIRYDLGRGWGVKATSGQRQTGADISYTIER